MNFLGRTKIAISLLLISGVILLGHANAAHFHFEESQQHCSFCLSADTDKAHAAQVTNFSHVSFTQVSCNLPLAAETAQPFSNQQSRAPPLFSV